MDPSLAALLASLAGGGAGAGAGAQGQGLSPARQNLVAATSPNNTFGSGGGFVQGNTVSTEALLALFSQQANTAAALAALQSGSAAAMQR